MWCKFHLSWVRHRRMRRLDRLVGGGGLYALLTIWEAAMEEGSDEVDLDALEDDVAWDGEPGALVAALTECGFLSEGGQLGPWYQQAAGPWLDKVEAERVARDKAADRQRRYRDKRRDGQSASRNAKSPSRNAEKASRNAPEASHPPVRDGQSASRNACVTSQQRDVTVHKKERKKERTPAVAADGTIEGWVTEWERREAETGRKWPSQDRGFFGSRGPFAMRDQLVSYRDRRGPKDAVDAALQRFWSWWDSDGKRLHGRGWRPSPANVTDVLETYLVDHGMLTKQQWIEDLAKGNHAAPK